MTNTTLWNNLNTKYDKYYVIKNLNTKYDKYYIVK